MTENLPANVQPHDEAAAAAFLQDERPALTAVKTQTRDCEQALAIGDGDADEMQASGKWIQSTHYMDTPR